MTLREWCDYDLYYWTRTEDPSEDNPCGHCPMKYACMRTYGLHCNHLVFSDLSKMTEDEVKDWVDSTLSWRDDPLNYRRRGEVFWTMSCSGKGVYDRGGD